MFGDFSLTVDLCFSGSSLCSLLGSGRHGYKETNNLSSPARGGSRNFRTLVKFFRADIRGGLLLSVCGGCSISYSLFARQPTRLYCHDIVVSRNCLEFCFTHRHVLLINKLLTFLSAKRHILYN
jgi:hypothetical protein